MYMSVLLPDDTKEDLMRSISQQTIGMNHRMSSRHMLFVTRANAIMSIIYVSSVILIYVSTVTYMSLKLCLLLNLMSLFIAVSVY